MLNGKWILMEYDAKNNLLVYTVDEMLKPGPTHCWLKIRDGKGNRLFIQPKLICKFVVLKKN